MLFLDLYLNCPGSADTGMVDHPQHWAVVRGVCGHVKKTQSRYVGVESSGEGAVRGCSMQWVIPDTGRLESWFGETAGRRAPLVAT
jgi:hypothetical protein